MKKAMTLMLAAVCCGTAPLMQAAEFKGKVTKPDGVTPLVNVDAHLYKFDSASGYFNWFTTSYTDNNGLFSLKTQELGGYLVTFNRYSDYDESNALSYPYGDYNYYYYNNNDLSAYFFETYNDVRPDTPAKAPTQFPVTDLAKVTSLGTVKLNNIKNLCRVTGPITINGTQYYGFSTYYASGGPKLPAAGGTLNISFKVQNLTSNAISTNLQGLAFLERSDSSYVNGAQSVQAFPRKALSLPANATTTVSLAITVPSQVMAVTPSTDFWAFNMGVQMVSPQGVANCNPFKFPVLHVVSPASAKRQELADMAGRRDEQKMIPLRLSETGEVLEWGPMPEAK